MRGLKLFSGIILAAGLGLYLIPYPTLLGAPTLCLFKLCTGLACWGCGLTRGLWFLLHGDLSHSLQLNPLTPLVGGIALWLLLRDFKGLLQQASAVNN